MNNVTMLLQADPVILNALREDISNEDISTNAVMPRKASGEVELICKEDGVVAGLPEGIRTHLGEIYVFFCPGSGQL